MSDIFSSSRSCVSRAKEHILDLENRIKQFFRTQPTSFAIQPNPDGTQQLHKYRFFEMEELPPIFANITFDVVCNLRSALDQAGFATAVAAGKVNPKHAYFPLANDINDLHTKVIKGRCKDIPNDILTLFVSFKPYKGGNNFLWALNQVCVTNKHRMLVPFSVAVGGVHIRNMPQNGTVTIGKPIWDGTQKEIILTISGSPDANWDYNIQLTPDIAFDEVEVIHGKPTVAILNEFVGIVERIIVATEAEARRIGII